MLLDFGFVYLSQITYTGVYTDNHYKKGLNFNQIYKSEIYQDQTGWKSTIDFKNNKLTFSLHDSNGQPILGAHVVAKVIRPVTDKHDQTLPLHEENGVYTAKLSLPLPGQWEIRVKATQNTQEYIATRRINYSKPQ